MGILNAIPGAVAQGLIWGITAIGLYISYRVLDFSDLTVDGSICTGASVAAMLLINGVNVWIAMLAAFVAGMLCGLVTGLFHTKMGIPPILAGILTQLALWSVNLKILGQANRALNSRTLKLIVTQLKIVPSILVLLGFVAVIIALLYWFFGTEFGSAIRATGANEKMARAQGINTSFCKIFALMLSNGLVALSGALLAQYQGFADINMGRGAIVIALAAIIIGTTVVKMISHNFAVKLFGAALGGVLYYIVYQVIIALGFDTDLLKMLSAIVVAIFLAIPYWKKKMNEKPKGEKNA